MTDEQKAVSATAPERESGRKLREILSTFLAYFALILIALLVIPAGLAAEVIWTIADKLIRKLE